MQDSPDDTPFLSVMSSLPPPENAVKLLTRDMLAELRARAHSVPRLRTNYNFHASLEDNPHRFLNVMCRGTYITPHRHLLPPKSEAFLVLEGLVAFVIFEEGGAIASVTLLGPEGQALGIDIAPGIWHTLVVLSEDVVCYEVKPGPYSIADDKEFAPWAPREGRDGWDTYLERLTGDLEPWIRTRAVP